MANGMDGIMQAMKAKNAMVSQAGAAKVATPGAGASGGLPQGGVPSSEIQRIAGDSNADASPQKNAADLDIIALKLLEFDEIFKVMLPALDKMQAEHNELMQALAAAQGGTAAPVPAVPPQGGAV